MIATDELANWLRANGIDADTTISTDGEIPPSPDKLIVLTRSGGPGTARERTFDNGTVQVITRDGQYDGAPAATEALAQAVDDILLGAVPPLEVGARRVIAIDQEGGPPAFLDRDGPHVLYVCSYVFQVARTVF